MDLHMLIRLTSRFVPLLLLLSSGWITQGHSSLTFESYIKDTCGMSRLPEITITISYAYHKDDGAGKKKMNHWATVNIEDFKFPFYELQDPTISQSDLRRFENMVLDGEGHFVLRAEAERAGQPPKSVLVIEPLLRRRNYITVDYILLYLNAKTLDFTLFYQINQTQVGFHPFSSIPKVAFHGFVFVICEDGFHTVDQTSGPFSYTKKVEL